MGSYGTGTVNGMYGMPGFGSTSGMSNMLGNTGSSPTGKKGAIFQPSKSLRDHISLRLDEQWKLLRMAEERIHDLVGIACNGRAAQKQKIGDQHISAGDVERVFAMAHQASFEAQTIPMGRLPPRSRESRRKHSKYRPFDFYNDDAGFDYSMYSMNDVGMLSHMAEQEQQFATMPQQPMMSSKDMQKMAKAMDKADPLRRYQVLEGEIQALLRYSGVFSPGEYVDDPVTRNAALKHVLGTGKGNIHSAVMEEAAEDSDDEEVETGRPAPLQDAQPVSYAPGPGPAQMNYQQPQYLQMPPNHNGPSG